MKTKLEMLQDALESKQRYLRFLDKNGTRTIHGVGGVACVVIVVASGTLSRRGPFPGGLTGLILVAILGGLISAVILMGFIWLLKGVTKGQIASYQEAIDKLGREE